MRTIRLVPVIVSWLAAFLVIGAPMALGQQAPPKKPALPKGCVAEFDVSYIPGGDESQTLDIYYPETKTDEPLPLLVWIHGGGWTGGSKDNPPYINQLRRGYVVASVEYRFSQKATFPAQIQDCQAAIRWLRANAEKYNIDPKRVGVGGASAGGHLAALVGTSGGTNAFPPIGGNEEQSDQVQAVCDIFGPADFWTVIKQSEEDKLVKNIFKWNEGDPYSKLIGGGLGQDKEKCDAVSPTHYVSKDDPPFLILHGDRDTLVPFAQSEELADLLEKAGVTVVLQRFPGSGHGGPAFGMPIAMKLTNSFFDKYLKGVDATIEAIPADKVTIKTDSSQK